MLKMNFLVKKGVFLLFCMMFMSHFAMGMFTVRGQKPVIRKPSTYSVLKPLLEKEKEKAKAANLLMAKKTAANLLMEKEIEATYFYKFYVYNEKTKEGALIDKDILLLSTTFNALLGDITDEKKRPITPSERLIPVSDEYSGEAIKNGFDLLKKYQEKQSILDDVANMDLKNFTEFVNFCDYLDLGRTDMNAILSNELINRIKKVSSTLSQSDIQRLESIHPDFVKTFVFPKAVWDLKLMAVLKGYTDTHEQFFTEFDRDSFSICDMIIYENIKEDQERDYYTWIFTKNNQWFLQFFYVPKVNIPWKCFTLQPVMFNNINNNGKVIQLRCNWSKKRAVVATKGSGNNGIVLDFNNINNIFGFGLPECATDINSIAINNDANLVAASFDSEQNNIIVWGISAGQHNITIEKETHKKHVSSIMFAKNKADSDVIMYCSNNAIYSKNMNSKEWKELASFDNPIQGAEMSSDGKAIAVVFDSYLILVNAESGRSLCKHQKGPGNCSILFSPDNTYFEYIRSKNGPFGDAKWINNTFFGGKVSYGSSELAIFTPFNNAKKLLPQDLTMNRLIRIYNFFNKSVFSKTFDYLERMGGNIIESFKGYFNMPK